jgi:hypothetical protein
LARIVGGEVPVKLVGEEVGKGLEQTVWVSDYGGEFCRIAARIINTAPKRDLDIAPSKILDLGC